MGRRAPAKGFQGTRPAEIEPYCPCRRRRRFGNRWSQGQIIELCDRHGSEADQGVRAAVQKD